MTKDKQEGFNKLQKLNLAKCSISLCIIVKKRYRKKIEDQYSISYVRTSDPIKEKLKSIISQCIEPINNVEKYTIDCSESVEAQVWSIDSEETEFPTVFNIIENLSPEEDVVKNFDGIEEANAYAIIVSEEGDIKAIGFRKIPESWGMKINRGLISVCFTGENTLEFPSENPILSLADNIDFISYGDELFIFSSGRFEIILSYREHIIENANLFYDEAKNTFEGTEDLKEYVGKNMRLLRKVAIIRRLKIYEDKQHYENIKNLNEKYGWGFKFRGGKMVIDTKNKDSINALLSVLQNKRLYSEVTEEHFDTEYAKLVAKNNR